MEGTVGRVSIGREKQNKTKKKKSGVMVCVLVVISGAHFPELKAVVLPLEPAGWVA